MINLQSNKPDYGQILLENYTKSKLESKLNAQKQRSADQDMLNQLSMKGFDETQEGEQGAIPIQFSGGVKYFRQKQYKPEDMSMQMIGKTPEGSFYQRYNNVTKQFEGSPELIKNKGSDLPTAEKYAEDMIDAWKTENPNKPVPAGLKAKHLLDYKRLNADDIYKNTKAKEKAKFEINKVQQFPKMRRNFSNKMKEWDTLENTIDRVVRNADAVTTGQVSEATRHIRGTKSYQVARDLETIAALISFNKLTEMRLASPTGGALGQVSNFENRLLQATSGSLDQGLSASQLKGNLKVIKNYLKNFRKETEGWYYEDYGDLLLSREKEKAGSSTPSPTPKPKEKSTGKGRRPLSEF